MSFVCYESGFIFGLFQEWSFLSISGARILSVPGVKLCSFKKRFVYSGCGVLSILGAEFCLF